MTWAKSLSDVEKDLDKFEMAIALFAVVYSAMRTTVNVEKKNIEQFPKNVAEFSARFLDLRKDAGFKETTTPKLDCLMEEVPTQMQWLESTGRYAEDPIEHLHQTFDRFWRAVSSTTDKTKLMSSLIIKLASTTMPLVMKLNVELGNGTKRNFSEETVEKKDAEERARKKARGDKERAVEVANPELSTVKVTLLRKSQRFGRKR